MVGGVCIPLRGWTDQPAPLGIEIELVFVTEVFEPTRPFKCPEQWARLVDDTLEASRRALAPKFGNAKPAPRYALAAAKS